MARLTPLSKGLIGLAVIGAVASAAWHLALKDIINGENAAPLSPPTPVIATPSSASNPSPAPVSIVPATPVPVPDKPVATVPPASTPKGSSTARLSAAENAELGRKYLNSGNFEQARVYLEQAVEDGDGAAACHLGEMTLKGQGGIPASQEKAASLFQMAIAKNIICFASGR